MNPLNVGLDLVENSNCLQLFDMLWRQMPPRKSTGYKKTSGLMTDVMGPIPPPEITGWEMSWLFETTFRKVGLNKEPKHHSDVRFDLCFFRILLQLTEAPTEPLLKPY